MRTYHLEAIGTNYAMSPSYLALAVGFLVNILPIW